MQERESRSAAEKDAYQYKKECREGYSTVNPYSRSGGMEPMKQRCNCGKWPESF